MRSGPWPLDRATRQAHGAADRLHEAGDRFEQRRLAAAGRAEQHKALGLIDVEADFPCRGDEMLRGLVLQRHVFDSQQRLDLLSAERRHSCILSPPRRS